MINIDLITRMILEPPRPLITDVALTVGDRSLRYGQGITDALKFNEADSRIEEVSTRFPFTITVSGPGPARWHLKACRHSCRWG